MSFVPFKQKIAASVMSPPAPPKAPPMFAAGPPGMPPPDDKPEAAPHPLFGPKIYPKPIAFGRAPVAQEDEQRASKRTMARRLMRPGVKR